MSCHLYSAYLDTTGQELHYITHSRWNLHFLCCAHSAGETGYTLQISEGSKLCDKWYDHASKLDLNSIFKILLHKPAFMHAHTHTHTDTQNMLILYFCLSILHIYIFIYSSLNYMKALFLNLLTKNLIMEIYVP